MKTIQVKSHKRKGRIVRAHGRIKKENKLKKKGYEVAHALELTTKSPWFNSVEDAYKLGRKIDKQPPVDGITQQFVKEHGEDGPRNKKLHLKDYKTNMKMDKAAGINSVKRQLKSKFPYSK